MSTVASAADGKNNSCPIQQWYLPQVKNGSINETVMVYGGAGIFS